MGGAEGHLRPFMVAGGCAHTSLGITIDGQSCDVEHTTSDAFIRFSLPTYTQGEGVAHELVGIEASDAVAIGDRGEVDEVYEGVDLVQFLALQHPPDELFAGWTVSRRILAAGLIHPTGCGDAGQVLQTLCGQFLTETVFQRVDLIPEFL